jgi:hypothetical protein
VAVLTDYFRAPGAETVLRAKDVLEGPLSSGAGFDGVHACGGVSDMRRQQPRCVRSGAYAHGDSQSALIINVDR